MNQSFHDIDVEHENLVWGNIFAKELKKKFVPYSSYRWEKYYQEITKFILTLLPQQDNLILEAGSGSGKASILLGNKIGRKVLLDISENALKYAEYLAHKFRTKNVEYIQGNIFNIPFPDDTFNLVRNIGVLEHYEKDKIIEMLREMVKVCKRNGYIAFGVPNFYSGPTIKAWLLAHVFKHSKGYKLDTEKFYKHKEIYTMVQSAIGNSKLKNYSIQHFGSLLPMETPKWLFNILNPLNKILYRNKFLTFYSFQIEK